MLVLGALSASLAIQQHRQPVPAAGLNQGGPQRKPEAPSCHLRRKLAQKMLLATGKSALCWQNPYLAGCTGSHIGNLTGFPRLELSEVKLNLV